MRAALSYLRHALRDEGRSHYLTRWLGARLMSLRARLTRNPTRRLALLTRAARACPSSGGLARLQERLRGATTDLDPAAIDWGLLGVKDQADIPKGILLKPAVSAREKGVLHIAFGEQWLRLFRSGCAARLARHYDLLLGPSFFPAPEPAMHVAARMWPGPLYTLLSSFEDQDRMRAIAPNVIPVPLLASSWVSPALFEPHLGLARDIDIVMVANFAAFKRHWLFFHAIRRLPRRYRAVLVGLPLDGRTEKDILAEAEAFGVKGRFELVVRPPRELVPRLLCQARCSVIFSRREGSCVAVAESLLADTPVGLLANAHIGSKAFINEHTGSLLRPRRLAADLEDLVEQSGRYRPRAWAVEHISCHQSIKILNDMLRRDALRQGRPWTRDLLPFQMDTLPRYLDEAAAREAAPWREDLAARFGIRLGSGGRGDAAGAPAPAPARPAPAPAVPC